MRPAAVLTDLDGTLLDHGGVLGDEARAAIGELRRRKIPVVPLTSKTEVELREFLAERELGGIGSFENGAGVFGPAGVLVSEKAVPVAELSVRLRDLARLTGLRLTPAAELPTEEICRITGFPADRIPAMLARGFGLPFLAPDGAAEALEDSARRLPATRLTRGGQFWHLSGNHGKEDAVDLLLRAGLVSRPFVGLGDAPNDAGFLALCNVAVLVPRASGEVDPVLLAAVPEGRLAPFPAGRGWAAAVEDLLGENAS
jgi:mannosyl-3-phosphoglycerate phosphatase